MTAFVACIGYADLSRSHLIRKSEKPAVRTRISTKPLLPKEIDGHETANKKKRDGHPNGWKGGPKVGCDEMVCKLRDQRLVRRFRKITADRRPHEHIKGNDQRHKNEKA